MTEHNKEEITEEKPVPIRRSDIEDSARVFATHVDRFLNNILIAEARDVICREEIDVLKRYMARHIITMIPVKYEWYDIRINAPWLSSPKATAADYFLITIELSEQGRKDVTMDDPNVMMCFRTKYQDGRHDVGHFKTETKYVWYEC